MCAPVANVSNSIQPLYFSSSFGFESTRTELQLMPYFQNTTSYILVTSFLQFLFIILVLCLWGVRDEWSLLQLEKQSGE